MRWPLQPFQQTQLQPPFGQSVASLCHPWFTTTNFSYRFPIFETSATALCGTTGILCKQGSRWRFPKSWGYPQSSIDWDFPWNKPSSYPHDYGTPQVVSRSSRWWSVNGLRYTTGWLDSSAPTYAETIFVHGISHFFLEKEHHFWRSYFSGWWCNKHLEKYESMGRMTSHILWQIKAMFETTNHISYLLISYTFMSTLDE